MAEITANFEVRLKSALQKAEAATVKRALHTWQELQGAIASAGGGLPDKHLLANFIREHAAPTRAYTALGWLVRNLKLPFDLSEVVKPRAGLGARLGEGQPQAATLEPSMVLHLLGTLESTVDHPHWPLVFCAYAMCFGVVRYTHLQRSYLVGGDGGILVHGARKARLGAAGALPGACHATVARWICRRCWAPTSTRCDLGRVPTSSDGIGWALTRLQPNRWGRRILRPHLSAAMDVTSLSSYSFRRVLPTLAGYVGLPETERLALGQWVDQSSKTLSRSLPRPKLERNGMLSAATRPGGPGL